MRNLTIWILLISLSTYLGCSKKNKRVVPAKNDDHLPISTVIRPHDAEDSYGEHKIVSFNVNKWNFGQVDFDAKADISQKFLVTWNRPEDVKDGLVLFLGSAANQLRIIDNKCKESFDSQSLSCSFRVKLQAKMVGKVNGVINIRVNGKIGQIANIYISGEVVSKEELGQLKLKISPNLLQFPPTEVGETSKTQKLVVSVNSVHLLHKYLAFKIVEENNSIPSLQESSFSIVDNSCENKLITMIGQKCHLSIMASPKSFPGARIGSLKAFVSESSFDKGSILGIQVNPIGPHNIQYIAFRNNQLKMHNISLNIKNTKGWHLGELIVEDGDKHFTIIISHKEDSLEDKYLRVSIKQNAKIFKILDNNCNNRNLKKGETCSLEIAVNNKDGQYHSAKIETYFNEREYFFEGQSISFQGIYRANIVKQYGDMKLKKDNYLLGEENQTAKIFKTIFSLRKKNESCEEIEGNLERKLCYETSNFFRPSCKEGLCDKIEKAFMKECHYQDYDCKLLQRIFHFQTECYLVHPFYKNLCIGYRQAFYEGFDKNWVRKFIEVILLEAPQVLNKVARKTSSDSFEHLSRIKRLEISQEKQKDDFKNNVLTLRDKFPNLMVSYLLFEDYLITKIPRKEWKIFRDRSISDHYFDKFKYVQQYLPKMFEDNQTVGFEWELHRVKWDIDGKQEDGPAHVDIILGSYFQNRSLTGNWLKKVRPSIEQLALDKAKNWNWSSKPISEIVQFIEDEGLFDQVNYINATAAPGTPKIHMYYPFYDTYKFSILKTDSEKSLFSNDFPWLNITLESRYLPEEKPILEVVTGPLPSKDAPLIREKAKETIITAISPICQSGGSGMLVSDLLKTLEKKDEFKAFKLFNTLKNIKKNDQAIRNVEHRERVRPYKGVDHIPLTCLDDDDDWNEELRNVGYWTGGNSNVQSNVFMLVNQFFTDPLILQTMGFNESFNHYEIVEASRNLVKYLYMELLKNNPNQQILDPRNHALGITTFIIYQMIQRTIFEFYFNDWSLKHQQQHLSKNMMSTLLKQALNDLPRLPFLTGEERKMIHTLLLILVETDFQNDLPPEFRKVFLDNIDLHYDYLLLYQSIEKRDDAKEGKVIIDQLLSQLKSKIKTHFLIGEKWKAGHQRSRYLNEVVNQNGLIVTYGDRIDYQVRTPGMMQEVGGVIKAMEYKNKKEKKTAAGVIIENRANDNLFNYLMFYGMKP